MRQVIKPIFQIPLIEIKLQNWEEKKKKLLDLYKSIEHTMTIEDSLLTDYWDSNRNYIKNIHEIFISEITAIQKTLNQKFKITNCWYELAKTNQFHPPHNHGHLGYSCVCYINYALEQNSKIHFVSPFLNFMTAQTMEHVPELEEGLFLCFPSSLLHYTTPNQSTIERLVVSFNLYPD